MDRVAAALTLLAALGLGFGSIGWARVFRSNGDAAAIREVGLVMAFCCAVLAALGLWLVW